MWEKVPGSWKGPLGVGETGGEGITGWGVWVTGWGVWVTGMWSWQRRKVRESPPGLADVCSSGTGGKLVADPTTVSAEAGVRPATAFLRGKGAMAGAGAIRIHGRRTR